MTADDIRKLADESYVIDPGVNKWFSKNAAMLRALADLVEYTPPHLHLTDEQRQTCSFCYALARVEALSP